MRQREREKKRDNKFYWKQLEQPPERKKEEKSKLLNVAKGFSTERSFVSLSKKNQS